MKNLIFGLTLSTLTLSTLVVAELAHANSSYAGQQVRDIKALAPQTVLAYLNGKGLGYAKAAELNHFPGPSHVLELAKELNLTAQQVQQTQALFDSMKVQASALGKQFLAKERELDRGFSSGSINVDTLQVLLSDIGTLQAKIRFVHLRAHLQQKALLTERQTDLYDQLRGYGDSQTNSYGDSQTTGHSSHHE